MRQTILFLLLTLLFSGCDVRQPPDEVDPDAIFDETPIYSADESTYPYDFDKYKAALNSSKLQFPRDNTAAEYGEFTNYKSSGFYTDKEGYLHFTSTKEADTLKTRSELREEVEWRTDDVDGNYWIGRLKCLKPDVGITSYTWMQIHGTNESYNYPVLRLFWARQRDGQYDHLWAVVIVNDPLPGEIFQYVYTDLGPRTDEFFSAEVHVRENLMIVMIDRDVKLAYRVGYWQDVWNYYKAGIYVNRYQDGGEASVIFESLEFLHEPSKIVSPYH